jgi:hypothetical protein
MMGLLLHFPGFAFPASQEITSHSSRAFAVIYHADSERTLQPLSDLACDPVRLIVVIRSRPSRLPLSSSPIHRRIHLEPKGGIFQPRGRVPGLEPSRTLTKFISC